MANVLYTDIMNQQQQQSPPWINHWFWDRHFSLIWCQTETFHRNVNQKCPNRENIEIIRGEKLAMR